MNVETGDFSSSGLCLPEEAALLEGVELFLLRGEECPYFADKRPRESLNFMAGRFGARRYEALLSFGWRRCGRLFYKSLCPGCAECHPIRVDVQNFKPSRSQSRCATLNKDIEITAGEPSGCDEDFELFNRYCASRHDGHEQSRDEFKFFLAEPPLPSVVIRHRDARGRLLCAAWTDVLPDSLSAVYTAFDPEFPKRGLGVFSILSQIDFCQRAGLRHLQLGFHIKDCRKMSYKSLYRPCESPDIEGVWQPVQRERPNRNNH